MKAKNDETKLQLGPLQRRVLEFVWDNPGCRTRECVEALNQKDGSDYAYTTIQTVLNVLHDKKLVSRRRVKTAYIYKARQSRTAMFGNRLKDLFTRFSAEPEPVASSLVDFLSEDDPEQLKALVDELKKRGLT